MDWFEEWFDSPFYEILYADRDEEEAALLVDFLEGYLSLQEGDKILDLGCGRGRHAIQLYKNAAEIYESGYQVTGVDLSERAITTAREQAKAEGFENIRFEVRDMRNPLPEKFDAILNLFTTFGYFESDEENASVLASVRQMLVPKGFFVIDYLNAVKVRNQLKPSDEGRLESINYRIHRYIENDSVCKDITFSGDDIEGTRHYSERVKLYDLKWFQKTMSANNLVIDNVFGDYRGGEFDPEKSDRLLIISHLKADGKSRG
jgi:cyclopropane fatty-acyl-phospholipid synthase-like methyltransferase